MYLTKTISRDTSCSWYEVMQLTKIIGPELCIIRFIENIDH